MQKVVEEIQAEQPQKSVQVRETGCYCSTSGIYGDTKEPKHRTPRNVVSL